MPNAWITHTKTGKVTCYTCGKLKQYHEEVCDPDDIRRHKNNLRARTNRRAKDDVMHSLGMVKVRGNLGGTYWE